ncbi:hypothetical protein PIB30_071831 [Stylosanthes scabra]|uniref:Regulatory protein RecX n=1 Tax=Stylosanthes scabra TaxID=79078 RepID=A0ABU6ZMP9_9FABA|nr:hypothetical protein [Stylosanthes scabra]
MANSLLGAVKISLPGRSRRSTPPPSNKDEAAKREAARKDALQNYVTFVYYTNLAESYRSVIVTWCKSPTEHSLCMSLEDPSDKFTCKIDFESGHAWGKKGLKSFEIEKARIDVFWDFRHAKFSNNPQPSSGYYVALVYKKEVALLLGDLEKDAYERTKSKPSPEKAKLLCKRENVSGKKMFCTKAMLYDGEKEHDIVIETSLSGPDDPEMWISIDAKTEDSISINMASFAGNIGFKISCQLPFRVFSIRHRTLLRCHIVCLKSRNFSSSENSLPGKNLKSFSCSSHPDSSVPKNLNGRKGVHGSVTRCENFRNPNEIHNSFEEGCEQMEEAAESVEELSVHLCEQDSMQLDKFINDAEESAIRFLASRALTAVELRKKLLGKRFSPNVVEAVINKFQRSGMINDKLYAESLAQSRWSSSTWGPRRIKQVLFKKGVSQTDAENAVEVVFKGNDCEEDHNPIIGLSKQSIDHLYAQASKQWSRGQNISVETRKSRIIRWLQYRGFGWNVINLILKKLEGQKQDPP